MNFTINWKNNSHPSQYFTLSSLYHLLIHWNHIGMWNEVVTLVDYATVGNSASLPKIDDKIFTITHIEDSDYTQGNEVTKGVKITTQETFDIAGNLPINFTQHG